MHAGRHTAATLLLEAGVAIEVVSAILGHSGIAITADIYARVLEDAKRRAFAAVDLDSGSELSWPSGGQVGGERRRAGGSQ